MGDKKASLRKSDKKEEHIDDGPPDSVKLFDEVLKLSGKMDNMEHQLATKMDNIYKSFEKKMSTRIDDVESSLQTYISDNHTQLMLELDKHRSELQQNINTEVATLQTRLQALEEKAYSSPGGAMARPKFDPEVSIMVSGLPFTEGENICALIQQLFSEGLGLDCSVVDALRLKSRGTHPGSVKVECATLDEKISVLRLKAKLKDHPDFKNIYMRSAKSHTDRLIELNFRTILQEIPGGEDYFITGNGRLKKRDNDGRDDRRQRNDGGSGELRDRGYGGRRRAGSQSASRPGWSSSPPGGSQHHRHGRSPPRQRVGPGGGPSYPPGQERTIWPDSHTRERGAQNADWPLPTDARHKQNRQQPG